MPTFWNHHRHCLLVDVHNKLLKSQSAVSTSRASTRHRGKENIDIIPEPLPSSAQDRAFEDVAVKSMQSDEIVTRWGCHLA